ncbi:MAG: hypothetical protein QM773_05565 [Hyphomonadaceae bacterium]
MTIGRTPVEELLIICQGEASKANQDISSLEGEVKSRLRKVGGKGADFVPYLMNVLIERGVSLHNSNRKKLPTIAEALQLVESSLGSNASEAVSGAFAKYVSDYDVSYKLKSA